MEFHSPTPLPVIPDHLTLPQFIFHHAHPSRPQRDPKTPWMIQSDTGQKFFGEGLRRRSIALAKGLKFKYNLGEDDVVLIFSRNHIDYAIMTWAVHMLGGIISGANPEFHINELVYQINETKPALIVTQPEFLATAQNAMVGIIPSDRIIIMSAGDNTTTTTTTVEDLVRLGLESRTTTVFRERQFRAGEAKTKLAFLSFSSGTTGNPKAVRLTHYGYISNIIQLATHNRVNDDSIPWEDRRFRPGDVVNGVLPLYHAYGMHFTLHFCLFNGMTYVLFPRFNYVEMLEGVMRYGITHLMLVPPLIVLLCKHPATKNYDLQRHVRCIKSGAAPLPREIDQRLREMFPNAHIGQDYGMTELSTVSIMWPVNTKHGIPGSSGIVMPGVSLKILKSDGKFAGYDEVGEMLIKTPSVALGYANSEKATRETFIDGGWVRTGDIAKVTPDGEVFVVDRLKEVMKVKAFPVAPAELEGCILDHPDVASTCVVSVLDDYSGELPLAFVVLHTAAAEKVERDPETAQNIKKSIFTHVAINKAKYKHLTGGIEFIASIPTSPSGKLLRRILRDKARAMRANATFKP